MVTTLLAAFDSERIYFSSRSPMIDTMLDELDNFEIRISEESHNRFGAFKTGVHGDLVVALGIAVHGGEQFGTQMILMW